MQATNLACRATELSLEGTLGAPVGKPLPGMKAQLLKKKKKQSEGSQTERQSSLPILLGTSGYICKTICKEELDRRSSEDH